MGLARLILEQFLLSFGPITFANSTVLYDSITSLELIFS